MEVRVKKLSENAVLPVRAHSTDAGFDLVATSQDWDEKDRCYVYGTGLAIEIPDGYVGLVFPRSSIVKKDLHLTNSVGVIDSGYRGEIMAKFAMDGRMRPSGEDPMYKVGERIAQLVIMKLPDVQMAEVSELGKSDRGTGGFGSTGM